MTNFTNATQTNPAGIPKSILRKYEARDPTTADYIGYTLGDLWENRNTSTWWILISLTNYLAIWVRFAGPNEAIISLTGNTGGPVFADSNQNVNTVGAGPYLVNGNPATHTLTWTDNGTIATIYQEDTGTATPAANILNVVGAGGIKTAGFGNTVAIIGATGVDVWLDISVNTLTVVNAGYFCTAALTATLPASPVQGDNVAIFVDTASTVVIRANTGQTIRFNQNTSTVAGTATNSARGDLLWFVYRAADLTWQTTSHVGLWSLA